MSDHRHAESVKMRRLTTCLTYVFLVALALGLIYATSISIQRWAIGGVTPTRLSTLLSQVIAGACSLFVCLAIYLSVFAIREWRRDPRKHLPPGVTLERIWRESPYQVTLLRQGEGLVVVDKKTGEPVVWQDKDGPEAWVIRQYLKEYARKSNHRTPS